MAAVFGTAGVAAVEVGVIGSHGESVWFSRCSVKMEFLTTGATAADNWIDRSRDCWATIE